MNDFDTLVTLLGATILALALASKRLAESPMPPTLLALLIGVAVGPEGFGWLDLGQGAQRADVMEKAARLALGIGLVGVALRIPSADVRRQWRQMMVLTGLGMPLMWGIGTAVVYVVLDWPIWLAALVGAVLAPTDPVAATPIVTGRLAEQAVPGRLRHALSFDSGANDGLAYLFVFLALLMLTHTPGDAMAQWVQGTLLWDVGVGTIVGGLVGLVGAHALRAAEARGLIAQEWRLIYTVALALMAIGVGRLIHSDEVLLVFAAAVAFDQVVDERDRLNEEQGQEAVNRFFAIPIFVLLGATIPWGDWRTLGLSGAAIALAVLLLRRPLTLLLLRPWLVVVHSRADLVYMGWFGPIAVAAVYYASLVDKELGDPRVWPVVSLVACASVVAHGLSAAPLTRWYGRASAAAVAKVETATARRRPVDRS